MEEIVSEVSKTVVRKPKRVPSECQICGALALYSNYGAMSCASCKMFFKRHGEMDRATFKCDFGGHCQANIYNRHICSSCRLDKCFAVGMQTEFIRCSRSTKNATSEKKKVMTTSTLLVRRREKEQPQRLPTLNLLQSDRSTLNADQWNLLSNLVHCYDEHNGFPLAEHFIAAQNALPLKYRFKCSSVSEFFRCLLSDGQLIYEKNSDFLSLCSHDRSTLIRTTVEHTACVISSLIVRQYQLLNHLCFLETSEILFGSGAIMGTKLILNRLDSDMSFVKVALSILAFSTINYTVYKNTIPVNLTNVKIILRIQNMYIELAWQYLLYKYGHTQAVLRFSNLIRWIFSLNLAAVEADKYREFSALVHYVIEKTEQTLVIDS